MTKEELLAKAKKDYPPGTVFIIAHLTGRHTSTIKKIPDYEYYPDTMYVEGTNKAWCSTIYYKGEWAEVIKKGITQENLYKIY